MSQVFFPGTTTGGKPSGLFYMQRFFLFTGSLEKKTYFFDGKGKVYIDPISAKASDLAKASQKGTYALEGNQLKITIDNGLTITSKYTSDSASTFEWDYGIFSAAHPVDWSTFSGEFETGAVGSSDGNFIGGSQTYLFQRNGTLVEKSLGSVSTNDPYLSGSSTTNSHGQWSGNGYELQLNIGGKATTNLAYLIDSLKDHLYVQSSLYKRISSNLTANPPIQKPISVTPRDSVTTTSEVAQTSVPTTETTPHATPKINSADINNTSALEDDEQRLRTFDSAVQEFKVGTEKSERLAVGSKENSKTWALWGEGGNDTLIGGSNDDYLVGGDGIDSLKGGKGIDTFVITDVDQHSYDIINDFTAKDDVIGISKSVIDAGADDTVALVTFKDIRNKATAEKTFKTKKADKYILIDNAANILKVNSKSFSEKIQLSIDLTNKAVLYSADGAWGAGQDILCKFTGKISQNSWSPHNFAFGLDVA